jgi:branched-chain amino acid transport system permease protein
VDPGVEGLLLGAGAAAFGQLPDRVRSPVARASARRLHRGLFAGLLRAPLMSAALVELARLLFTGDGLTVFGAVLVFTVVVVGRIVRQRIGVAARVAAFRQSVASSCASRGSHPVGVIVVLPLLLGPFFAQVIALVALYILMGFGLNITLGLAGLLDLGFVAFFAVGAYTGRPVHVARRIRPARRALLVALPFAMLFAAAFGAILGLPILSIRGDYLAIATLGFGEIIHILAGSNLLLPVLGGPRGIINIPKPIEVRRRTSLPDPSRSTTSRSSSRRSSRSWRCACAPGASGGPGWPFARTRTSPRRSA